MDRATILKTAKPILFNTEMVRAIQNGIKTVTRRLIKPKFTNTEIIFKNGKAFETVGTPATTVEIKSPYNVGDILYVRETWLPVNVKPKRYLYKTHCPEAQSLPVKWHPSIHMPKEAARIFLRVTGVRVGQLQDITEEQAIAEGIFLDTCFIPTYHFGKLNHGTPSGKGWKTARECFGLGLWNSTVKKSDLDKYGWSANPGVRVIEFEKVEVTE